MKNTKNLILLITFTASTLTSSESFAISPRIKKNVCLFGALPITFIVTVNGLLGSNLFGKIATTYKQDGITPVFFIFPFTSLIELVPSSVKGEARSLHIPTTIMGVLGMATSYAAMRYFDNQIKAQQQSNSLNHEKKE